MAIELEHETLFAAVCALLSVAIVVGTAASW
jgi:hypothetical protein